MDLLFYYVSDKVTNVVIIRTESDGRSERQSFRATVVQSDGRSVSVRRRRSVPVKISDELVGVGRTFKQMVLQRKEVIFLKGKSTVELRTVRVRTLGG